MTHASTPTPGAPAARPAAAPAQGPSLFDWLPWEKFLIWGLFFLVVYALRDFFFIIFMTFITTYIMRTAVRRIARFILPGRESVWLDRGLSVGAFAVLLLGLYGIGNYLGPAIYDQGETLIQRVRQVQPERVLNDILTKTAGAYLFRREYGSSEDARYRERFAELLKQGPVFIEYVAFPELERTLVEKFELEEAAKIKAKLSEKDFESWFLREKAPGIYETSRDALIAKWEQKYEESAASVGVPPLAERKKDPDFAQFRDQRIRETLFRDLEKLSQEVVAYRAEWQSDAVKVGLVTLHNSSEYDKRFEAFYESLRAAEQPAEGKPRYEFAKFLELRQAYAQGEDAFRAAIRDVVPADEDDRLAKAHAAFEQKETAALMKVFLGSPEYFQIRSAATDYVKEGLATVVAWIPKALGYLGILPVQLALSLLLSFFITWDIPRLRRGILSLKRSRMQDFYEEIAPGLYNFGRLIGRAFLAQGLIAVFNTILTFVAIRALGIQNEVFLCAIVFLCSFIPVLGVVLSSVPIAIMAIVQPGGSIILALEAIGAILVIHFIETSILNPKILGDMLHLHPVLVLAVLAIGEHFFKVWGLLLAVPVTVYIIRCVILNEEIPGLIEADPLAKVSALAAQASGEADRAAVAAPQTAAGRGVEVTARPPAPEKSLPVS